MYGGTEHQITFDVLVNRAGALPYRYVTRGEVLAFLQQRATAVKADRAASQMRAPMRPRAEQDAEIEKAVNQLRKTLSSSMTPDKLDARIALYRTRFKYDEENRDEAMAKSNAAYDKWIAKLQSMGPAADANATAQAVYADVTFSAGEETRFGFAELKEGYVHCETFCTEHGPRATRNDAYFKSLPSTVPQLFLVSFMIGTVKQTKYHDAALEKLRDDALAKFDYAALAALLDK